MAGIGLESSISLKSKKEGDYQALDRIDIKKLKGTNQFTAVVH